MRTTLTDAEYDRLMREVEDEIEANTLSENEKQIMQEIAAGLLLSGRHLEPGSTQ